MHTIYYYITLRNTYTSRFDVADGDVSVDDDVHHVGDDIFDDLGEGDAGGSKNTTCDSGTKSFGDYSSSVSSSLSLLSPPSEGSSYIFVNLK